MESVIIYAAFFLICFNISGLATTNILRLTRGNTQPILAAKCYCDDCGATISPFLQLPIISYIICKGRCRSCKTKIPMFALLLEITVLAGMFALMICAKFAALGVTLSFLFYELIRICVIFKAGKRENDFAKQYLIAVLAMLPFYAMALFVSLLYSML